MATPHVSGVAALAFSLKPTATWQQVKDAILTGVDQLPSLAGKTVSGGRLNAFNTLQRILLPPSVVGRHLFYNNSVFDGSAAATADDDRAIASDKKALMPGATATFANYSSYSKGINGIFIDVLNFTGTPTAADFGFKVGTSADPSTGALGPAPTAVTLRRGAGVGGSDRITLTFADGAIKNKWLQVTTLANAR